MSQSIGKDDFISNLKTKNIDLILRYTDDGRIYGATYIDHNTKSVLNGSRLGKEFSANALDKWFKNPDERPLPLQPIQQPDDTTQGNTQSQASGDSGNAHGNSHAHNSPSHTASNDHDYTPDFGLGGLFSVGPAFDPEEEAFYREMQRRKKKRRGPKL